MKIKNLAISIIGVGILSSCTEELHQEDKSYIGTTIDFNVRNIDTKINYDHENIENNLIPILWESTDLVNIYCAQAEDDKSAVYSVSPSTDEALETGPGYSGGKLLPSGDKRLSWGGHDNTHYFYGVYPASEEIKIDDGIVTFPVGNQTCIYNAGIAKPDVRYAYMVSSHSTTPGLEAISLSFKPIMTTLRITINGRANGKELKVRGLVISNDNFTDGFDYNIKDNVISKGNSSPKKDIYVNIEDQSSRPYTDFVTISSGQTVTLTAFLPPFTIDSSNQIKIQVLGADNDDILTVGDVTTEVLPAGKFYMMDLPELSPERERPNNPEWIESNYDELYISQLSIPGSHESAASQNYGIGTDYVCQTASLTDQWNYGIRCFDFSVDVYRNVSYTEETPGDGYPDMCRLSCDEWKPTGASIIKDRVESDELYLYASNNNYYKFKNALDEIYTKVKSSNEFAIILLHQENSPTAITSSYANEEYTDSYKPSSYNQYFHRHEYYRKRTRKVTEKGKFNDASIFASCMENLLTHTDYADDTFIAWNPDLKVRDCKGKIIVISDFIQKNWNNCSFTDKWSNNLISESDVYNYWANRKYKVSNYVSDSEQQLNNYFYVQNYVDMNDSSNAAQNKKNSVERTLVIANYLYSNDSRDLVINYLSGYDTITSSFLWITYTSRSNITNAQNMNTLLNEKLSSSTFVPTGILLMDLAGTSTYNRNEINGNTAINSIINNNKKTR